MGSMRLFILTLDQRSAWLQDTTEGSFYCMGQTRRKAR